MSLRGRRRFGTVLWVLGVAVAVPWAMLTPDTSHLVPGIARAVTLDIAAVENGRLESVAVGLHAQVDQGEVVAQIDGSTLRALREVAAAEFLAVSNADIGDPKEHTEAVRKRASTLQLQTELSLLDRQIDGLKALVAEGAASQNEVDERALERQSLVARIRAKRAQNGVTTNDATVGPSAWAVVASLKRLEAVDTRLDKLALKSTLRGRVSAVLRRSGEVVRRGDPIVRIAQETSNEVLAFVPPHRIPKAGDPSTILRADGTQLNGSVISVSPSADLLPESIWKVPGRPEHGVTVLVRVDEGSMVPNEVLRVQL